MLAYHGDEKLRQKFINRAQGHRKADEIIQRYGFWLHGKGCAIGCLAHTDEKAHEVLEQIAGLPQALSRLADIIFEQLPDPDYRTWPERFASAAQAGADLGLVHHHWLHWLLTDEVTRHFDAAEHPDVSKAIAVVAELRRRCALGGSVTESEWAAARAVINATSYVCNAARGAARHATRGVDMHAASAAAMDTARAVSDAASSSERDAAWQRMAGKLVELMAAAKGGAL